MLVEFTPERTVTDHMPSRAVRMCIPQTCTAVILSELVKVRNYPSLVGAVQARDKSSLADERTFSILRGFKHGGGLLTKNRRLAAG